MGSPLTHAQLALLLFLIAQGLALEFIAAPLARKYSPRMALVCHVVAVVVAASGGVFLLQWAMYGLRP